MADETALSGFAATAAGVTVQLMLPVKVAALRYFDASGEFMELLAAALGMAFPSPQRATAQLDADLVLAWRSPTETLLLSRETGPLEAARRAADSRADGCVVDQTGGIVALIVTGQRAADLLVRLGSTAVIPAVGEARTGSLAELSVSVVCVRTGEMILLVERVYLRHLCGWIRTTLQDF